MRRPIERTLFVSFTVVLTCVFITVLCYVRLLSHMALLDREMDSLEQEHMETVKMHAILLADENATLSYLLSGKETDLEKCRQLNAHNAQQMHNLQIAFRADPRRSIVFNSLQETALVHIALWNRLISIRKYLGLRRASYALKQVEAQNRMQISPAILQPLYKLETVPIKLRTQEWTLSRQRLHNVANFMLSLILVALFFMIALIKTSRRYSLEENHLMQGASEGVAILNAQGRIQYLNLSYKMLLGLSSDNYIGTLLSDTLSQESIPDFMNLMEQAALNGTAYTELVAVRADGIRFDMSIRLTNKIQENDTIDGYYCYTQDISARKSNEEQIKQQMQQITQICEQLELQKMGLESANRQLRRLATRDGLTGLTNHRAFQETLSLEWKRAKRLESPLSLLMIDVDNFKEYNDSFGHPAGDQILRKLSVLLTRSARVTDCAARYGGEEFAIILPHTNLQGALEIAERLRYEIECEVWEHRKVTISIGVASAGRGINSTGTLLAEADRALYLAKRSGRNRVMTNHDCSAVMSQ